MPPTTNTLAAAEDALSALLAGTLPASARTKRRKSRPTKVASSVVDEAARIRALKAASKVRQKELEVRDRILSMREEKTRGSKKGRKRKALEVIDDSDDSD